MANRAASIPEQPACGVLEARTHTAFDGIPFFDQDLQVAQSKAHRTMVVDLASILTAIAQEAGLVFLADEPIWYLHPETDAQKAFYGDCVLSRAADHLRITAEHLLIVFEVVSTTDRRKELKDTRFQRLLNEYNDVPEFVMLFPEPEDPRALTFCRLVDGLYQEHTLAPGGSMASASVPGLVLRVRAREEWQFGRKFDVFYRDELRPPLDVERQRTEQEKARAEQEKARAEQEKARAEQEKARAERLAERLRALGVDPDGEL